MDFTFNEEQKLVRDMARKFVDKEVKPIAAQIDKEKNIPPELIRKIRDQGLMGMIVPPEYGGGGVGEIAYCLAVEEFGRGCASTTALITGHQSIGTYPIIFDGSSEQKRKYLPLLASGEKIGAFALTEPDAGSDAANIKTTAVRDGDDFVINGTKLWITNGDIAGIVIVFAVTDPGKGPKGGISAFIVESDTPGFRVGTLEEKMGLRGSSTAELIFDNMRVPSDNLLGIYGSGFITAMKTLNMGRLGLGAASLGAAKELLELSVKHAKERVQFGKPIAEQEAIQFMIAEMGVHIFNMESTVYRTAWRHENGEDIARDSAMVKLYCSESLNWIADAAMQIHGGMGYMTKFPIERFYRDARINRIFEGTSEIQKLVISRSLIKGGKF